MAEKKANEAKISIKVIVDKVHKKVVYAEADHTFVDILFSFMTLPMGTIVRLLGKHADTKLDPLGSLNNLYQSLKGFPECYFATKECKCMLLNPRSRLYGHCRKLKLKLDDTEPSKFFKCPSCPIRIPERFRSDDYFIELNKDSVSSCNKAKCVKCGTLMTSESVYMGINNLLFQENVCGSVGGLFVSDIATYIVTDDLCVMPYSSTSCIRLLTDHGITDKSCLGDMQLHLGCEQVLYFLKVALSLDYVFTYLVFHRTVSVRSLVVPDQSSTLDQTDTMKQEESPGSKILLEVSLQKSTGKVLFVEAKEDFVDFLFGCLSIPFGTILGMMKGNSSVICMDNIFKSISNMSVGRYLKSQDIKDMLLKPHIGQWCSSRHQLFLLECTSIICYSVMKDPRIDGGLLKQSGFFLVTDDLRITPSTSSSTINTLDGLKVSFDDIKKHEISIGLNEGIRILKASLKSCSTLTDSLT